MTSEVHITRAEHWAQNRDRQILASEWHDLVSCDPELRLACSNGPHFVIWSGESGVSIGWLEWNDGNISTKFPDERLLAKMLQIAERLGAHVQSEEGEVYTSVPSMESESRGNPYANPSFVAFISSLIGLLALGGAVAVNELVRQQFAPIGSPPFAWRAAIFGLLGAGGLGWLLAAGLAIKAIISRRPARDLAIAALGIDVLTACVLRLFW